MGLTCRYTAHAALLLLSALPRPASSVFPCQDYAETSSCTRSASVLCVAAINSLLAGGIEHTRCGVQAFKTLLDDGTSSPDVRETLLMTITVAGAAASSANAQLLLLAVLLGAMADPDATLRAVASELIESALLASDRGAGWPALHAPAALIVPAVSSKRTFLVGRWGSLGSVSESSDLLALKERGMPHDAVQTCSLC